MSIALNLTSRNGPPTGVQSRLASLLVEHRQAIGVALVRSISDWPKWASQIAVDGVEEFAREETVVFADYLSLLVRTGDESYRHLYIGEKLKQAFHSADSPEQAIERRRKLLDADEAAILDTLGPRLGPGERELLLSTLRDIGRLLTTRPSRTLNVLLVGDCLFLDILAFVTAPLLADDIEINPLFVTSKNPVEARNAIRALADRKFDLVFYSPFTYEFDTAFAQFQRPKLATASGRRIRAGVHEATAQVTATLDLLTDLFDCNTFVHNTANVRRHNGDVSGRLRALVTRATRHRAAEEIHNLLDDYVARRNAATFPHLFVIDERPLVARHGEFALGKMFYRSKNQHPAAMGKWLAEEYREIIATHAWLLKRKLVVCDLDNTLWEGVIGEGAVHHFDDRQRILKRLKDKGVILAINSKNDPKNVHFNGGILGPDDFVCSMINWDPKPSNVKRIAETLNLKAKDFVFVDDREDEREMVRMCAPGLLPMDATAARTWDLMSRWATYTYNDGEVDRTTFYKQRERREEFVKTREVEDHTALYRQLDINVTIRPASKNDHKRVVELINRTNQFNTCATRTSLKEVTAWDASDTHEIYVVDAADKFGTMGTVCILVARIVPGRIEIPAFVLSCRVFGYGIEVAALNQIKRRARALGSATAVVSEIKETPHNQPCRAVYSTNGFVADGSRWTWSDDPARPIEEPAWLTVTVRE